ncbi:unnamed protein product [Sphagnum jensenii]|uniref:Uncharacterized protein n=1 Tax=Sphagnum jensenii TaxID=128206 RepID=A0ABP0WYB0_9BRYO
MKPQQILVISDCPLITPGDLLRFHYFFLLLFLLFIAECFGSTASYPLRPGFAQREEGVQEVEEENTQVRLITAEEGLQEVQVRPLQTPELVKKEQEEFPSSSSSPSSLNIEGSSAGHVVVVTTVDEVKSPQAPTGVDASPKHVALLTAGGNTMMLHHWQK